MKLDGEDYGEDLIIAVDASGVRVTNRVDLFDLLPQDPHRC